MGALAGGGGLTAPPLVSDALGCSGAPGHLAGDDGLWVRTTHVATNAPIVIRGYGWDEEPLSNLLVEVVRTDDSADAGTHVPIAGTLVQHSLDVYLWMPDATLPPSATLQVSLRCGNMELDTVTVTTAEGPVLTPSTLAEERRWIRASLEYTGDVVSCADVYCSEAFYSETTIDRVELKVYVDYGSEGDVIDSKLVVVDGDGERAYERARPALALQAREHFVTLPAGLGQYCARIEGVSLITGALIQSSVVCSDEPSPLPKRTWDEFVKICRDPPRLPPGAEPSAETTSLDAGSRYANGTHDAGATDTRLAPSRAESVRGGLFCSASRVRGPSDISAAAVLAIAASLLLRRARSRRWTAAGT